MNLRLKPAWGGQPQYRVNICLIEISSIFTSQGNIHVSEKSQNEKKLYFTYTYAHINDNRN